MAVQVPGQHFITAAFQGTNGAHMMQGTDISTGILRRRQVIQIQGILGLHRAAQIAVTTMHAGALGFALRVYPGLAVAIGVWIIPL